MRPQNLLYILILGAFTFTIPGCKKDRTSVDSLPAATQEGKNTLGCIVNGHVFARKPGLLDLMWRFEFLFGLRYSFPDRYALKISASQAFRSSQENIMINGDSVLVELNKPYPLQAFSKGNFVAQYMDDNTTLYETTDDVRGQLIITKIDTFNRFVAGTFFFTAVSAAGDSVKITDGRFDLLFD